MSSLLGGLGCFAVAILVFIVVGFQRGWRRELISLVAVLLATVLINVNTSNSLSTFLGRIGGFFAFLATGQSSSTAPVSFLEGPVWSLVIFASIVILGYIIGDRVFPSPKTPHERFLGILPSVLSGAFILGYLDSFIGTATNAQGGTTITLNLSSADPTNFVPVIFLIGILAVIVALIAVRVRKAQGKK